MNRSERIITQLESSIIKLTADRDRLKRMSDNYCSLAMASNSELSTLKAGQADPVGWQFYQDGQWWNGEDRIKDHRVNTAAAGYPVRDLYASPLATGVTGIFIGTKDVEHLMHARKELGRLERAPLRTRQALIENINSMLAAAQVAK